jgi:hypothetical protein
MKPISMVRSVGPRAQKFSRDLQGIPTSTRTARECIAGVGVRGSFKEADLHLMSASAALSGVPARELRRELLRMPDLSKESRQAIKDMTAGLRDTEWLAYKEIRHGAWKQLGAGVVIAAAVTGVALGLRHLRGRERSEVSPNHDGNRGPAIR